MSMTDAREAPSPGTACVLVLLNSQRGQTRTSAAISSRDIDGAAVRAPGSREARTTMDEYNEVTRHGHQTAAETSRWNGLQRGWTLRWVQEHTRVDVVKYWVGAAGVETAVAGCPDIDQQVVFIDRVGPGHELVVGQASRL